MRYTAPLYARALFEAIEEQPKDRQGTVARFLALVRRRGDGRLLPKVLAQLEALMAHAQGGRVVRLMSARPLPERELTRLRATFGEDDRIHLEARPELIAGVKIVVDGEWAIDASMKRKLQKLFL